MLDIPPFEPEIIEIYIRDSAPTYHCQRTDCSCGVGKRVLKQIEQILDEDNINDPSSARAFAHGVRHCFVIIDDVKITARKKADRCLSLLVIEALRRAGDVHDDQIEAACQKVAIKFELAAAMGINLEKAADTFGDLPYTPGNRRSDN